MKNRHLIVYMTLLAITILVIAISIAYAQSYDSPIKDKIHKDLWKLIEEESKPNVIRIQPLVFPEEKTIDVLVQINNEEDLDYVGVKIKLKGGDVKGRFKLGDVVTARVPVNRIVEISE